MLTKDDVSETDGGWWLLPSIRTAVDEAGLAWLKETFDQKDYNKEHFSWDHSIKWLNSLHLS